MELEPQRRHLQVEERASIVWRPGLVRANRFLEGHCVLEQTLRSARDESDDCPCRTLCAIALQ
jgi:hypothetical protein